MQRPARCPRPAATRGGEEVWAELRSWRPGAPLRRGGGSQPPPGPQRGPGCPSRPSARAAGDGAGRAARVRSPRSRLPPGAPRSSPPCAVGPASRVSHPGWPSSYPAFAGAGSGRGRTVVALPPNGKVCSLSINSGLFCYR